MLIFTFPIQDQLINRNLQVTNLFSPYILIINYYYNVFLSLLVNYYKMRNII